METALAISMRWLHIASVIVLLGGVFYARFVTRELAAGFKPMAYGAIGAILVSGTFNFLNKSGYPPHYHMWFGIKVLLALHVFAAVALYRKEKLRALTGVLLSGAAIVAISGYLRWISIK